MQFNPTPIMSIARKGFAAPTTSVMLKTALGTMSPKAANTTIPM
ncbi:hypothetical protein [Duodenibacillus massiliensis]